MKNSVTVLTSPTVDTDGTALILSFEDTKYIFGNVHEGLQRACIQNGTRLGRLKQIFLTGKTEWRTVGGLMGFVLTLADVLNGALQSSKQALLIAQDRYEKRKAELKTQAAIDNFNKQGQPKDKIPLLETPQVHIHGGDNVNHLLATARRFIFRKGLPLKVHEYADQPYTSKPTWEDQNIQVWALPLRPREATTKNDASLLLKRSHDVFLETSNGEDEDSLLTRKQKVQSVVGDMFNSNWNLDTLVETPLAEVRPPTAIFVRNPDTHKIEKYEGPLPGQGVDVPDLNVLVRTPWPGALVPHLPRSSPSPVAMSYIVRNQPKRGKFDQKLAIELGIKPGPAYRELANGNSVTNDKGDVITFEQVTGGLQPGKAFAVVELPSVDYISSMRNCEAFSDNRTIEGLEAIFWILGPGLTAQPSFQEFVARYPNIRHIISSRDHCANYLSIDAAASAQLIHRAVDHDRFPVPVHDNDVKSLPYQLSQCILATRGVELNLEPTSSISAEMKPPALNTLEVVNKMSKKARRCAEEALRDIQSNAVTQAYSLQKLPMGDTEIIPLGTGSSAPSKNRNVSATLVRVPGVGSYLLDCGENTLGQLGRMYSQEELNVILRDLKFIWISHMHADHHLGLASVIRAWHTAVYGDPTTCKQPTPRLMDTLISRDQFLEGRLCIAAEPAMLEWLAEYSDIEEYGYNRILPLQVVPCNQSDDRTRFKWNSQGLSFKNGSALQKLTGLTDVQAVYVSHCSGARAVSMTWESGLKISYSGDCRPSANFAKIGNNSTLLIHEATFDDTLIGDAIAKRHSTTKEAIGVGLKMNAKCILLTHFSQRYSKVPEMQNVNTNAIKFDDSVDTQGPEEGLLDDTTETSTSMASEPQETPPKESGQPPESVSSSVNMCVAFDTMRFKLKDIMLLKHFNPAFAELYGAPEERSADAENAADANEARKITKAKRAAEHDARALRKKTSKASLASNVA